MDGWKRNETRRSGRTAEGNYQFSSGLYGQPNNKILPCDIISLLLNEYLINATIKYVQTRRVKQTMRICNVMLLTHFWNSECRNVVTTGSKRADYFFAKFLSGITNKFSSYIIDSVIDDTDSIQS